MNGVAQFYYTRTLPSDAVAIAQVQTIPALAAELIDVSNKLETGTLGVWRESDDPAGPKDDLNGPPWESAVGLNVPMEIEGSRTYALDSQFFELTDQEVNDTPLFYAHPLDTQARSITILDSKGNKVDEPFLVTNGRLYHNLSGALYWVRYIDSAGIVRKLMLRSDPAIAPNTDQWATPTQYYFHGRYLEVFNATGYWIRFTDFSINQVLAPYGAPPNAPWFPRIRFSLKPPPPEWALQIFLPQRPYMLASWVPGTVIDPHVIEFERKSIYKDDQRLPDVLVFDKNYQFKYALEGTDPTLQRRRGTLYPWKRGQIVDVENANAFVQILPTLAPDDICYGFYSYLEPDIVFTGIDCNPFTNPNVKNCTIRFFTRTDELNQGNPSKVFFYAVLDYDGSIITTDDPLLPSNYDWISNPAITVVGDMFVGASISSKEFQIDDARVRGGGLAQQYQGIPEAANFWDIGFIDGKPYPIGGALVVYLPKRILDTMTRDEVMQRVNRAVPMGALAHIRYIDPNGQETL